MKQKSSDSPFIRKMCYILNNENYSHIICWDSSGTMIDILNQKQMEKQIIPKFFRHRKFKSFVRQLNLYGFKKIKKNGIYRFQHQFLNKGKKLSEIISEKKIKIKPKFQQKKIVLQSKSVKTEQTINFLQNTEQQKKISIERNQTKSANLKTSLIEHKQLSLQKSNIQNFTIQTRPSFTFRYPPLIEMCYPSYYSNTYYLSEQYPIYHYTMQPQVNFRNVIQQYPFQPFQ